MGYLSDFGYDIFISYSHADNIPRQGDSADKGWVAQFADAFSTALTSAVGANVNIAFDHRSPSSTIGEYIEKVQNSACLLIVGSRTYIRRDGVAMEEFKGFRDKTDDTRRIFAIERISFERSELGTDVARDVIFKRFYSTAEGANLPYSPSSEPFERETIILAQRVGERLEQLAGKKRKSADARDQAALGGKTILLAEVPESLRRQREDLASYLGADVETAPRSSFPTEGPAFEAAFRDALKQSQIVVQLLDENPGPTYAGLREPLSVYQFREARAAGKTIVQWRPPNLHERSETPAAYLQLLRDPGVEVRDFEEFKRSVKNLAKERPAPAVVREVGSVFVNADAKDADYAREFSRMFAQENVAAVYQVGDGDGSVASDRGRQSLKTKLTQCDILVYLFKDASLDWINTQILNYKVLTKDRAVPPRRTALCVESARVRDAISAFLPEDANPRDYFVGDWQPDRIRSVVRELLR